MKMGNKVFSPRETKITDVLGNLYLQHSFIMMSSEFGEFGKDSQREVREPKNVCDDAPEATFWTVHVQKVFLWNMWEFYRLGKCKEKGDKEDKVSWQFFDSQVLPEYFLSSPPMHFWCERNTATEDALILYNRIVDTFFFIFSDHFAFKWGSEPQGSLA